jgi:regulator of protease activity HflC (stomatin/prohibitin superfamily)
MFDRLIDLLTQFLDLFRFWIVIDPYERGLVIRLGRLQRTLDPGLHWLIPMGVDVVISDNRVRQAINLRQQCLTTSDGVSILTSLILSFSIEDIETFLLEIEGAEQVFREIDGVVAWHVRRNTWDEIREKDFINRIRSTVRGKAKAWGVEILELEWGDLVRTRALRVFQTPGEWLEG